MGVLAGGFAAPEVAAALPPASDAGGLTGLTSTLAVPLKARRIETSFLFLPRLGAAVSAYERNSGWMVNVTAFVGSVDAVTDKSANKTNAGTPSKRKFGSKAADEGPLDKSLMTPREIARQ